MQFLVIAQDSTDIEAHDRRLANRAEHLKHVEAGKSEGKIKYAAALLDEAEMMCGSMLVCEFLDSAELSSWLSEDVYLLNKVWGKISIQQCKTAPIFAG
jgi:uncharacterized protein YciI